MRILITAMLLLLTGCTITDSSHVVVGQARQPISPESVKIYTNPPAKYEDVAMVSAQAAHDFLNKQQLVDASLAELKKEAAALGANGILLDGVGNYQTGASGVMVTPSTNNGGVIVGTGTASARTGKEATGMAIYVISE